MKEGQKMFYDFFMARVKEGKEEEAKELLLHNFELQDQGEFTKEYLDRTLPKYFDLIKPEAIAELKEAMAHFGSRL